MFSSWVSKLNLISIYVDESGDNFSMCPAPWVANLLPSTRLCFPVRCCRGPWAHPPRALRGPIQPSNPSTREQEAGKEQSVDGSSCSGGWIQGRRQEEHGGVGGGGPG